jgi:hypothetical protein
VLARALRGRCAALSVAARRRLDKGQPAVPLPT